MRQYETIWSRLKTEYKVSVSSPRHYHARIIKAVKKEKWKDAGFKLLCAEQDRTPRLLTSRSGPVIIFQLIIARKVDLSKLTADSI